MAFSFAFLLKYVSTLRYNYSIIKQSNIYIEFLLELIYFNLLNLLKSF